MELTPAEAQALCDLEERILIPSVRASSDEVAAPSNGALERAWLRRPGAALLAFDPPHGLPGVRNRYEERHLIRNSAGKTISIPDNLYALQRDGTLKKVECCNHFRASGDLYNIDDKLVFAFDNARKFITDTANPKV